MSQAFSTLIPFEPSLHHSDRGGHPVVATIIHFTAGASAQSSIAWSKNPVSQASWHFIIDRDGEISQQVPLERAAWHAGAAMLPLMGASAVRTVNSSTIGIELCNHGLLHQNPDGSFSSEAGNTLVPYTGGPPVHARLAWAGTAVALEGHWEPFYEAQMIRLEWLLGLLKQEGYAEAASRLYGHEEVAVPAGRKSDPGAAFDWARFGRPDARITCSTPLPAPAVV